VHAVQFQAPHNYNRDSREAVYAWMARWLQNAPEDVRRPETSFTPEPLPDLLVFHQRPLPAHAVTADQLTGNWIAASQRQLAAGNRPAFEAALRHALGFGASVTTARPAGKARGRTVLVASADAGLERRLRSAGLLVRRIQFTPFDAAAAEKIKHFETYNRTAASQRVADIVAAARESPDSILVADGDAALAGLLASAVAPLSMSILDVGDVDTASDDMFLARLYMPGLRRAGDLQTAASMAQGRLLIHDAGALFTMANVKVERRRLTAAEIVEAVTRQVRQGGV
jgi:hypothetical protein